MNKRIAFFWGNQPMSWMRWLTLYSFRKFHPDWEIFLYRPVKETKSKSWPSHEIQDFHANFEGHDYRDNLEDLNIIHLDYLPVFDLSPVHLSDMFQWQWLYNNTGFYSDMDVLYLGSLDFVADKLFDFTIGMFSFDNKFSIGFLYSNKSDFYHRVFVRAIKSAGMGGGGSYQNVGCDSVYRLLGTQHDLYNVVRERYPSEIVYEFHKDLIYPWGWKQVDKIFNSVNSVPEISKAIHWYGGASLSQRRNRVLTENNYKKYNCTFLKCLEKIL